MFKPTHFRFDHAVMWPGAGPTTEIAADNVYKVEDQGETYMFIHACGYAFQIDKSQVTPYGMWTSDDVPNMPTPEEYKDGIDSPTDSTATSSDTDSPTDSLPAQTDNQTPATPIDDTGSADTVAPGDTQDDPSSDAPAVTSGDEPVAIEPSESAMAPTGAPEADNTDTSVVSPEVDPDAGTQDTSEDAGEGTDVVSQSDPTSGADGTDSDTAPTDIGSALAAGGDDTDQAEPGVEPEINDPLKPRVKAKKRSKKV